MTARSHRCMYQQAEEECLNEVMQRYFSPMGSVHWEGVEVSKYRHKLQQQQQTQQH